MASPQTLTTHPHIVRRSGVVGGEPTIAGTRIPVRSVVLVYDELQDIDRVVAEYPSLTPMLVEEALSFYRSHRDEIDRAIAENLTDS